MTDQPTIKIRGKEYPFVSHGRATYNELCEIDQELGVTTKQLTQTPPDVEDQKLVLILAWIAVRRAGEPLGLEELFDVPLDEIEFLGFPSPEGEDEQEDPKVTLTDSDPAESPDSNQSSP